MSTLFDSYPKMKRWLSELLTKMECWHNALYSRKFLVSLVFNMAIFAFTAVFGYVRYETCDDYLPAFYVSGVFGEYTHQLIYMNTLYTRFLAFLSSVIKEFPWYATLLFGLSFIGMTHFTWLLMTFNPKRKLILTYIIAIVVLWFGLDIYTAMQYTKVAMLLSGPALWGVFTLFLNRAALRDHKGYFIFCAVLFQIGGLIRFQSLMFLIVMTPVVCAMMFLNELLETGCWKNGIRPYVKFGICFISFFLIAGAFFGYHRYVYNCTPEGRFIMRRDYHSHFLMNYGAINYEKYKNTYAEIGFSKADVSLLEHWYFGSPEYYTNEKLDYLVSETSATALLKTNPRKFFLKRLHFFKSCFEHVRMAFVFFLLLFGIVFLANKKGAFWGGALAYYVAIVVLAYRGRIVDRIAYCMLLFALLCMIYGLQEALLYKIWNPLCMGKMRYLKLLLVAAGGGILAGPTLSCLNYFYINGEAHYLRKTQDGAKDVLEYISSHKDMVFGASSVFTSKFRGALPFRKFPFALYSNTVPVHGCLMYCSPHQFSRNGIAVRELPKQLVDNDNFYLISLNDATSTLYQVDAFLNFIKEHYYPEVKVRKVKDFDSGFGIYKYYNGSYCGNRNN